MNESTGATRLQQFRADVYQQALGQRKESLFELLEAAREVITDDHEATAHDRYDVLMDLAEAYRWTCHWSELVETAGIHVTEERDRVALGAPPADRVDVLEQPSGRLVPRPAEVRGELLERAELRRHHGPDGELADRLHGVNPKRPRVTVT